MQTIRERAKDLFPSVLMTLLSIIQALALVYALAAVVAQDMYMRARRELENQEFLGTTPRATRADLVLPLSVIVGYLVLAIGHVLLPRLNWLVPIAVLFALATLLHRLAEGRHYWNRSVGIERSDLSSYQKRTRPVST